MQRAFEISDSVVIKVPTNMDYFMIPEILKSCTDAKTWANKKFSVEIEEIYINEVLENVFLYFGKTAQITLEEEIKFLKKLIAKKAKVKVEKLGEVGLLVPRIGVKKSLLFLDKAE